MLSENEIALLIEIPEVGAIVDELKQEFLAEQEQVSDHDFLSSMLMAPPIAMALANGSISLIEEMGLNKKARNFSKGGFFLKKDPVVRLVQKLIDSFERWELKFYQALEGIVHKLLTPQNTNSNQEGPVFLVMLNTPYLIIKLIETFFLPEGEDIIDNQRPISKIEFEKMDWLGQKLALDEVPLFHKFLETFEVK